MEGKDLKRRFVQSTLFPHKESSIKAVENGGGGREEAAVEEEEEEWCGSSQKRRATKKKGNCKLKTTPRASMKKDIENGKEISTKQVKASDSPVIPKSSFFVKVSEQRQQNKQQQIQLVSVDSPEENVEICSVPSSVENGKTTPRKQRQQNKSTPRKEKKSLTPRKETKSLTPRKERKSSTPSKKMKSGKRELQFDHIPFDLTTDEQPLQKIPDLRLEAKMMAEENTRIFSGRQIHPFFTSWKGGKTSQALTDPESVGRKEKGIAFNPIHVFENVQDEHLSFNWGQWTFSERSVTSDLLLGSSPVCEGSVASLNFDNYMNISQFTPNSHLCSGPQKEVSSQGMNSNIQPNCTEDILAGSVEPVLQDHKQEKNSFLNEINLGENLDPELEEKLLQERIMSHYHTSHNQSENFLWTDKYQPQNAKQICGNAESVSFLSEWLQLWQARGSMVIRGCTDEENSAAQDVDCDYQQSESDNYDDEESLKNVLLVTGPVGSGKSAAIYACARDQGFQIIEINTSDWRNGALVKQKFGEAVESHWLQRSVENGRTTENKSLSKFFKASNEDNQCSNDEVIELIRLPDEEDSADVYPSPNNSAYKSIVNSQNEVKTLILFEDVDATLSEDHGFITTIQQLAVTAKRPMILTSNSHNPALPKNLGKLELSFSFPSVEELLGLANMICSAEKAKIHPYLLQRFVDHCRGDIRRTILLLQFWCQGQAIRAGNERPTTYWPVPFDLDAGHHILPKIIHWACPSQLSELVAMEVLKSLALMEETKSVMGRIKVDELNNYSSEYMCMNNIEEDPVQVKKAAMLSFQSLNEVECTPFEADPELFDNCCSPDALTMQNRRRKVNMVLSSDSEDEVPCGSIPLASADEVDEMKTTFHFLSPTEIHHPPADPAFQSKVDKLEENCSQLPEIVDYSLVEDTLNEMSSMLESSFVPETEIIQETELFSTTVTYCNFFNEVGSTWTSQNKDLIPANETVSSTQFTRSLHLFQSDLKMVGNDFDAVTASGYQEEVGDSLTKSEADVPRGFQVLDECSRVDFARNLKSLHYAVVDQPIDIVEVTWKSLHDQCEDFKKYVTAEERTACKILTFSHGISDLISEADLLRTDCQNLLHDSLLPLMVPSEKTHSYSYYEKQLEMSSILAEHGMCFYAKEIASLQSVMGCQNNLDLALEMLSSSANSVALGKLASRKADRSSTETMKNSITSKSQSDSAVDGILQTVVPPRSYLAAKGRAFHEYISTLSQISRYESSRLSNCIDNNRNRRRSRVPQHYLSSGSLSMSPEKMSSLVRHMSYGKKPSPLEVSDNIP